MFQDLHCSAPHAPVSVPQLKLHIHLQEPATTLPWLPLKNPNPALSANRSNGRAPNTAS